MKSTSNSGSFFSAIGKTHDRNIESNDEQILQKHYRPDSQRALTAYTKTFPEGNDCTLCEKTMKQGDDYVIEPGRVLCRACFSREVLK
ncbi:hypothetical protein MsAg5_12980 [Methanosarcinaceae archaeon Ag5]|uniref:Uncharacterized protein n=1 Tax=Methanolapillus africanus TaxID=3028297 RepID=A0AAE4MLU2_9EURY|nr:hypothetical protein [Methanosarcinaceae archaeon Ag5]